MSSNMNISEMLVHIGGDLLKFVESKQEMQAHLDIVVTAWNMALAPKDDRAKTLKKFIKKQKQYAPDKEALKGLEAEIKRIIKQKDLYYPEVDSEIVDAEAIEKEKDNYEIQAYFKDKDGEDA
ncbi:MAG: hypothetical protein OEX12_10350 [Gammaproteobacteria bacterium]|nr:hypothetical protein [Gammaproteobacteria bacterium]